MRPACYIYPHNRTYLLLDGDDWQIRVDPEDFGIKKKWYNFSGWTRDSNPLFMQVPSCWQSWGEIFRSYNGTVWYYKKIVINSSILSDMEKKSTNKPYSEYNEAESKNHSEFNKKLSLIYPEILLDFTAIDFEAQIWINGHFVGKHEGGYSRFSYDVARFLNWGENHLIVRVKDPGFNLMIPHGKQGGMWYSQTSGIWGSVYLEFIKGPIKIQDVYVYSQKIKNTDYRDESGNNYGVNDEDNIWLVSTEIDFINILSSGITNDFEVELKLLEIGESTKDIKNPEEMSSYYNQFLNEKPEEDNNNNDNKNMNKNNNNKERICILKHSSKKQIANREEIRIKEKIQFILKDPLLWHPNAPNLYGLSIIVRENSEEISDQIHMEIGIRSVNTCIEKEEDNSKNNSQNKYMIRLNDEPIIIRGVLDQAFHPDTLYNYPIINGSQFEFIRNEIILLKQMGINLNRKHIKIEDPRYIYLCDHLGMLYWEEMANFIIPNGKGITIFRKELVKMVLRDRNHPSVIIWGIFNEEWGIWPIWFRVWDYLIKKHYNRLKRLDKTRLIVDNSGWAHGKGVTDINDYHDYYAIPESALLWKERAISNLKNPHRNFRTPISKKEAMKYPIIVSEFGMGGLPYLKNLKIPPDLSENFKPRSNIKNIGDFPNWYNRSSVDGKIFSGGAFKRYDVKFPIFSEIYENREEAETLDQWKEFMGLKYEIEEMRLQKYNQKQVSGYVITELSDLEWEYNGLLDYRRNKKIFFDRLKEINDDLILIIRLFKHSFELTKPSAQLTNAIQIDFKVYYSNYDNSLNFNKDEEINKSIGYYVPVVLTLSCDALNWKKEIKTRIKKNHTGYFGKFSIILNRNAENHKINNEIFDKLEKDKYISASIEAVLKLDENGQVLNKNSEDFVIFNREPELDSIEEYANEKGVKLSPMLSKTDIEHVKNGGKVIAFFNKFGYKVILSRNKKQWNYKSMIRAGLYSAIYGRIIKDLGIKVNLHPFGENWISMFSHHFSRPEILKPLKNKKTFGWEFERLFPNYKFEIDTRWMKRIKKKIGMYPKYKILTGIHQGWFNDVFGTIVKIKYGKGWIILSLIPLLAHAKSENGNPYAKRILKNLIDELD